MAQRQARPGCFDECYADIKFIAKGSYGVVYSAKHRKSKQKHAVKFTPVTEPIDHEVEANENIRDGGSSRYVVRCLSTWGQKISDIGDNGIVERIMLLPFEGDAPQFVSCLSMEFLDGTLRDHIRELHDHFHKGFNSHRVKDNGSGLRDGLCFDIKTKLLQLTYFKQICDGVQFMHGLGYILRDLNPNNIMFRVHGLYRSKTFKLGDFGQARPSTAIESGSVAGTIFFSAPEVLIREFHDQSADIFSLGIILFALLFPMKGTNSSEAEAASTFLKRTGHLPYPFSNLVKADQEDDLTGMMIKMISENPANRTSLTEVIKTTFQRMEHWRAQLKKQFKDRTVVCLRETRSEDDHDVVFTEGKLLTLTDWTVGEFAVFKDEDNPENTQQHRVRASDVASHHLLRKL